MPPTPVFNSASQLWEVQHDPRDACSVDRTDSVQLYNLWAKSYLDTKYGETGNQIFKLALDGYRPVKANLYDTWRDQCVSLVLDPLGKVGRVDPASPTFTVDPSAGGKVGASPPAPEIEKDANSGLWLYGVAAAAAVGLGYFGYKILTR